MRDHDEDFALVKTRMSLRKKQVENADTKSAKMCKRFGTEIAVDFFAEVSENIITVKALKCLDELTRSVPVEGSQLVRRGGV